MLPVAIDLFSDIVCPWCFIGAARLEHALEELAGEVAAEVCYHPFFLDPQAPKQGSSVPEKLRKKYGVEPKQLFGRVEAAARDSGIQLDLSRQSLTYPTAAAHTLLRHAHAKGTQPALAKALFAAYFHDAKNIAEESVLAELAEPHGFSRAEALELTTSEPELALTREEAASAVESGIRGVPFFVFGGRLAVSGAQPAAVLKAAIRQSLLENLPSDPPPA